MEQTEQERFNELYQQHLRLLKLQGMADKPLTVTLGAYDESLNILIVAPIN